MWMLRETLPYLLFVFSSLKTMVLSTLGPKSSRAAFQSVGGTLYLASVSWFLVTWWPMSSRANSSDL